MTEHEFLMMAVIHAPNPSDSKIAIQRQSDKNKNPYNESHRPPLRDDDEIIIDYKIEFAKKLLSKLNNL